MNAKKFAAAVLALVMALSLTTVAFAGSNTHTTRPGSETIGVNGAYSGTGTFADVYSVKIEWGEMSFTYKTTGDKTWDPTDHTYNFTEGDGWQATGNEVTVPTTPMFPSMWHLASQRIPRPTRVSIPAR